MTVIRATNSLHTRAFDTSKFWWTANAWDERTLDWFAMERDGARRISHLIQAVDERRLSTLPNFQPTVEWLVRLFEEAPSMTFGVGNVTPREWVETAYAYDRQLSPSGGFVHQYNKYQTALPVIVRGLNLVPEDLTKPEMLASQGAMFGNPSLPSLPSSTPDALTPYQSLVKEHLDIWEGLIGTGRSFEASQLINLLLRNPGATSDDLLAAWRLLSEMGDPEGDMPWAVRQHYENFVRTLLSHPNWNRESPNVPSISEIRSYASVEEWPTAMPVPPGGRGGAKQQLVGSEPVLNGTYDNASQEFLFRRSRSSSFQIIQQSLKAWETDTVQGRSSRARIAAGHFAPALGTYFAELAAKYGADDVPLEWLLELT